RLSHFQYVLILKIAKFEPNLLNKKTIQALAEGTEKASLFQLTF
ncbi:MAG: hypothetical protein ACJAQ2_001533, partial [Vicingaceae bacterium]